MLADPNIDAVVVTVRVPLHHRLSMDVLHAGKHVYTEWPMAVNQQEAGEMADLARKQGMHAMVGLQMRAAPIWLRVKELLAQGYVGQMLAAHMTYFEEARFKHPEERLYHADKTRGVNTWTVTSGHAIDSFCWTVGEFTYLSAMLSAQVKEWTAIDTGKVVSVDAPDHVLVQGRLETGALGTVRVAALPQHVPGLSLEIYGTEGALVASTDSRSSERVVLRGGRSFEAEMTDLDVPNRLFASDTKARGATGPAVYVSQMLHRFAVAIQTGERAQPDFDAGAARMRLLGLMDRASETGERQTVDAALSFS
jgi:predicted dehydrogenase